MGATASDVSPAGPIGIFVHLYYDDLAEEIAATLVNIPYPFRVYVSTSDDSKHTAIVGSFERAGIRDVTIKTLPNCGWDVGPFLFGFREEIRQHEVCLRLHSKKSPHLPFGSAALWRKHLLDQLAGSGERIALCVGAFDCQPDLGMLIPPYYEPLGDVTDPGPNRALLERLLKRFGILLDPRWPVHFPCGSMFWFRSRALEPLLSLGLSPGDFGATDELAHDATLAHAVERAFLYSAAKAGFSWAMIPGRPASQASLDMPVDSAALIRESGLFDTSYYIAQNPGVSFAEQDPISHYVEHGETSDVKPYARFNSRFYRRLALQRCGWRGNPLVHYVREGRALGLPTEPGPGLSLFNGLYSGGRSNALVLAAATRTVRQFCAENVISTRGHAIGRGKALALFAMHEPRGRLTAYRRQLLDALCEAGFDIAIINSSEQRSEAFQAECAEIAAYTVIRRSAGRDFASWIVAHWELRDVIPTYDHILWINDSVFGPFRSLPKLCSELIAADADAVGLTDSWEHSYHLQSYFVLFKTQALLGSPLRRFIQDYSFPDNKQEIIEMGELGLTQAMTDAGLCVKAHYPYSAVAGEWLRSYVDRAAQYTELARYAREDGHATYALQWLANVAGYVQELRPVNPTHFFWDTLISDFGFPFVKKELVALNPAGVPNIGSLYDVLEPVAPAQFDAILESLQQVRTGKAPPWQRGRSQASLLRDYQAVEGNLT